MKLKIEFCKLQKARLARIRLAKATSGAAFLNKKRAVESRLMAQESGHLTVMMMAAAAAAAASSSGDANSPPGSGGEGGGTTTPGSVAPGGGNNPATTCHHPDDSWLREEDIFELQHHHLLRCLEKATVSFIHSFIFITFN